MYISCKCKPCESFLSLLNIFVILKNILCLRRSPMKQEEKSRRWVQLCVRCAWDAVETALHHLINRLYAFLFFSLLFIIWMLYDDISTHHNTPKGNTAIISCRLFGFCCSGDHAAHLWEIRVSPPLCFQTANQSTSSLHNSADLITCLFFSDVFAQERLDYLSCSRRSFLWPIFD